MTNLEQESACLKPVASAFTFTDNIGRRCTL